MTNAKTGWGGKFHLDNASGVLTELVEVVSFTLPNGETEQIDATHLQSPNRRREFIAGMIDDGELEVVMNLVAGSATDTLIATAVTDGVGRTWKAEVPKASGMRTYTGECVVTGYDRGTIEPDAKMEATMTIKLSGGYTEADA